MNDDKCADCVYDSGITEDGHACRCWVTLRPCSPQCECATDEEDE